MNPVNEISNVRKLNDNERDQIKKGAYVIIKDGGAFYDAFKDKGIQRRWSEHASDKSVYDVEGIVGNVLIGVKTDTWLQWERSKCCSISHIRDWIAFICSGKNQGPYGQSIYTDKNPLVIQNISLNF